MNYTPTANRLMDIFPIRSGSVTLAPQKGDEKPAPKLPTQINLPASRIIWQNNSKVGAVDMANLFLRRMPFLRIKNYEAVIGYLTRYPDLMPLILFIGLDAYHKIGKSAEYTLEYSLDSDADLEDCKICVRLPKYPDDFYALISSINESYDELQRMSSGYFRITTDFQNPRG